MRLRSGKECGDQRLGRSSDKLLRGRKRRLEDSGRFVPAAEVRREEMDAVMEVLLEEGDETMLSGALERILVKQKSALQKDSVLAKARGLGVQLQEVADMLTRQQASQHNSAVWPLTGDLTLKVSSCWLSCCGSDVFSKKKIACMDGCS